MPAEMYSFEVTVPAGTPASTPVTVDLAMPPRIVRRLEWTVPPGPNGNLGFAVGAAGVPIIPRTSGTWIVANNTSNGFDLEVPVDSGAWQAFGYNTGTYPHTVYLRFYCDPVTAAPAVVVPPVSIG